ncbi:MAG TPA: chemotaxis protein CheW [Beijerinckiaceae bacterium]|jgi:purine-binding chemotaxis protein CheW
MIAANGNVPRPEGGARPGEYDEYVTVMVADQMFGLPIDRVHDVFIASSLTAVPLAPREIVGLLNLRGRVVTAVCLRRRLGLPDREDGAREMAVGLEHQGESYGLLIDAVGEVMKLTADTHEPNPVHMDERWIKLSRGVHRLDDKLLIVLDVDAVLAFDAEARAA